MVFHENRPSLLCLLLLSGPGYSRALHVYTFSWIDIKFNKLYNILGAIKLSRCEDLKRNILVLCSNFIQRQRCISPRNLALNDGTSLPCSFPNKNQVLINIFTEQYNLRQRMAQLSKGLISKAAYTVPQLTPFYKYLSQFRRPTSWPLSADASVETMQLDTYLMHAKNIFLISTKAQAVTAILIAMQ